MPLAQGTIGIPAIYNGSYKIGKVYRGTELCYQSYNLAIELIQRTLINLTEKDFEGIDSIGSAVFQYSNMLENVVIPGTITSLGTNSFSYCENLKKVEIKSGYLENIPTQCFQYCSNLQTIIIPEGIKTIDSQCFSYCIALLNVTLPSSITSIGINCFADCSTLTSMTILATTPPTYNTNCISSYTTTIYVPSSSISAYQTASGWADLMTRETNPVTFIGI